jgi:exopolysaccharide transport family protein
MSGPPNAVPSNATANAAGGDRHTSALAAHRLWSIFLRRWQVISGTTAAVVVLVTIWLMQTTPIYTASTQVLIDPRKERVLREEAVISELGLDASTIATEVSLVKSFSIARRVVERLGLATHPQFGGARASFSMMAWISSLFSSAREAAQNLRGNPARSQRAQEAGVDLSPAVLASIAAVQNGVSVRRIAATYFIDISFSHPDAELAASLANAIAESYLVEQLEARYQAARRAATWLSERVAALRTQLEVSERALAEHRAKHNLVKSQSGTLAEQQAGEVNAQLVAARAQTVEKRAKYDQAQRILDGGAGIETVGAVMDSPVIAGLRAQQADLARQEADQLTRYGPEHPAILKIRAERGDLKRQMNREVARVVQALKTDYEFALKKEQSLEASLLELTGADNRNDQAVIRMRELERDAQSNRVLYESLLTRFKEAEQQTSLQSAESRIVAPALVPTVPSFPNKQRFMLIAVIGGFMLGICGALLLEQVENGFTTAEQVEQTLQVPVLAMVPELTERERTINGRRVPIPEYVALKPLSRFGESIRSVRVSTLMSNVDVPPKLVLITSSIPSEGKTTMMLSLAASAAAASQRVLLIDCDLRHPSMSKYFGVDEGPGLTDLLMGQVTTEHVFLRGPMPTMTLLPAGTTTRHPPDVLGSERLRTLLETVKQSYDVVFIDAPPVSPVVDSTLLAKVADKVVFVIQWRTTPREIVVRSLQALDDPRRKLAGVVVNHTQVGLLSSYAPYYSHYHQKYQRYYAQ